MQFRQFVDDDLGCASYLIGDESSGEAVVVDPAYAIEPYLEEARSGTFGSRGVLETHTHADHVSGHGRFALEHGVPVHVAPRRGARVSPTSRLRTDRRSRSATSKIRVLHTPGHRPEHCCFVVIDGSRGDEPWLVITGDSLLIGDAARPDLASRGDRRRDRPLRQPPAAARAPRRRRALSRPRRRLALRRGMSSKASSTIGFERRFNHALNVDRGRVRPGARQLVDAAPAEHGPSSR